jgi:hypothetical protein
MPVNAGGLVYGTILVATLLSAESTRRETYVKTVAAVAVALLAYWLTISYSEFAGERLEHGERFEYAALGRAAVRELALLYGAAVLGGRCHARHRGERRHLVRRGGGCRHRGRERRPGRAHRPRAGAPVRGRCGARVADHRAPRAAPLTPSA